MKRPLTVHVKKSTQVAVLSYPSTAWGRRIIRGVIDYARRHGPWRLWTPMHWKGDTPRLPEGWEGDGIIARLSTHAMIRHVVAAGGPVVNVARVILDKKPFPRVTDDVLASAQLAIEHFLDRGFVHFAYCGRQSDVFVADHCVAFVDSLHALGQTCAVYRPSRGMGVRASWNIRQDDLARWLLKLPKPLAVLTWTVSWGQQVIDACRSVDLLAPEQVAVLAGDDDDLMCDVCQPPLSGVAIDAEQIGWKAAELLDRLMRGECKASGPVLVPPLGIVTRQSTDTLAIQNPDLVAAIRFIREHAADPIRVDDVLRAVPISRRQLERDFLNILRRTPASEIRRVHLQRAKELLAETNLSIPEVAAASGFASPEYLAHAFRSREGQRPLKFRNSIRRR